jgi:HK97 gp10 family phage protein
VTFQINPRALAEIERLADRARDRVLDEIADDARGMAAVDTGEMRGSIRVDSAGNQVVVGSDHWQFVEYGTENMPAEPFMRPALYQRRNIRGGSA